MTEKFNSDERVRVSRELRTPITEASEAIIHACDFWLWLVSRLDVASNFCNGDPEKYFFEELFGKTFDAPDTDGDKAVNEIGTLLDGSYTEDGSAPFALIQVMGVVVDYSAQAMKAEKNGNHQMAWSFACDAQYWAGILNAELARGKEPSVLSVNALNAALARWRDDPKQAEKEFIRKCWCEWKENQDRYKSKAAFARDMLSKCEHLTSQKKIEDWCRAWEKAHHAS